MSARQIKRHFQTGAKDESSEELDAEELAQRANKLDLGPKKATGFAAMMAAASSSEEEEEEVKKPVEVKKPQ